MSKDAKQSLIHQKNLTIIVCALACEAKPFIDFFKLKKNPLIHAFSVFQSGSVILMVSGMGQTNMSAAVNWLTGYLNASESQFWINVGVAGHATANVGSLFCIHKVTNDLHTYYPTKWLKHKVILEHLTTFDHEQTHYKKNGLYDMEGFAFYQAATRFNNQESVQCLKIVSDNEKQAPNKDKAFISELISQNMADMIAFIQLHTLTLAKHHIEPLFDDLQHQLMLNIHFSHSQQLQLTKLCQAIQSHSIKIELNDFKKAKDVLEYLSLLLKNEAIEI